jgi:thiamine-phosphate pyrophosphorylase
LAGDSGKAKEGRNALVRAAATLGRRALQRNPGPFGKPIPNLWFLTDPRRSPDPVAVAGALPRGAVVVYRAFGAAEAERIALRLRQATRQAGVRLLIGADVQLARRVAADGVHLPERHAHLTPRLRMAHPAWLITTAAHSLAAIRRAERFGVDAILVSAAFPSRSPSARGALGPVRFAALARSTLAPVIALGGINGRTARRVLGSSAAGLAAVEAFSPQSFRT